MFNTPRFWLAPPNYTWCHFHCFHANGVFSTFLHFKVGIHLVFLSAFYSYLFDDVRCDVMNQITHNRNTYIHTPKCDTAIHNYFILPDHRSL